MRTPAKTDNTLTVLYDGHCGFCLQLRRWAERQDTDPPIAFLQQQHPEVVRRFPTLSLAHDAKDRPTELVAIDSAGHVFRETDAYLAVLHCMRRYRTLASRLNRPALRPLARRFFLLAATNRHRLSALLRLKPEPFEQALRCVAEPCCPLPSDPSHARSL